MNTITVRLAGRAETDKVLRTGATEDPGTTVVQRDTIVREERTGEPLMVVVGYGGELAALRRAFRRFPRSTVLRAAGVRNAAASFGFTARSPVMKRYECRPCAAAAETPAAHAIVTAAAATLAEQLAAAAPETSARPRRGGGQVGEEWRMGASPWTSGVLNTTSPLPYHYDRNNLEPIWSAMVVARRGVEGGRLHVPQAGVTVECRDGDVLFFPGWRFVHGVTPMQVREGDGDRFSAVYYTVDKMRQCLEPGAELAAGRRARTETETGMIERQRTTGHYHR